MGSSTRVGPFELVRPVGRGGMGEVWLGRHGLTDHPVAIKLIQRQLVERPEILADFRSEIRSIARLTHPGAVAVCDLGEVTPAEAEAGGPLRAGSPFFAMEWMEGGSLQGVTGAWGFGALRPFLLSVLDVLAHAHARGLVHRDIKPANILLRRTSSGVRYKLGDFGIARAIDGVGEEDSVERAPRGTAPYMAPEQIDGSLREQGPWTDLYALGCVVWELVTGAPPFGSGSGVDILLRHMEAPLPAFAPRVPVPEGLEAWLGALLAKSPAHRYLCAADATAVLVTLDVMEGGPLPVFAGEASFEVEVDLDPTDLAGTLVRSCPTLLGAHGLASVTPTPTADALAVQRAACAEPAHRPELPARVFPQDWRVGDVRREQLWLAGAGLGLVGLRGVPFVGRIVERDALWQAFAEVHSSRQCHAVILRGAAGVGKTRLAAWLRKRVAELGLGHGLVAGHSRMGGPYDGLPAALASVMRCANLDPDRAQVRLVRTFAERFDTTFDPASLDGLLRLLAPTLGGATTQTAEPGGPAHSDAVRPMTPPERLAVATLCLRAMATNRPVLLCLDDVQYGAEALGLCQALLDARPERRFPILVVLIGRDDALAERPFEQEWLERLGGHDRVRQLHIGPLDHETTRRLVSELLVVDDALSEQIARRSAGNPLFAVEIVKDGVERGVFTPGRQGFELRRGARLELPRDVHTVLQARIEALLRTCGDAADACLAALELAVAGGSDVDTEEWEAACAALPVAPLPTLVELLVAAELAERTPRGWGFVASLVREGLERTAREAGRWPATQRAWADALSAATFSRRAGVSRRVGLHRLAAGDVGRALEPLDRATAEAAQSVGFEAAEELVALRYAALDGLGVTDVADPRRFAVGISHARLLLNRGAVAQARPLAEALAAASSVQVPSQQAEALDVLGWVRIYTGRIGEGVSDIERALAIEVELGRDGLARQLQSYAAGLLFTGDVELALAPLERSAHLYASLGDRHGQATSWLELANGHLLLGQFDKAELLLNQALEVFIALRYRHGLGSCLNSMGEVARQRGELVRARALYTEGLDHMLATGSRQTFVVQSNLGLIHLELGQFHAAWSVFEEALEEALRSAMIVMVATVQAGMLAAAGGLRDWAAWDLLLPELALTLEGAVHSEDVARALELALESAELASWPQREARLRPLCAAQWLACGAEVRAAELAAGVPVRRLSPRSA